MSKALFVSIEGIAGSGKTTLIKGIEELCANDHIPLSVFREPGGVSISEQIRQVVQENPNDEMCYKTEALLYAASRHQLYNQVLKEKLEEPNRVVVMDRYKDSSFVYQGLVRGLGVDYVAMINDVPDPQITFILDVDPEVGQDRLGERTDLDRLDKYGIEFHQKVRQGYLSMLDHFYGTERIFEVVDTTYMTPIQVLGHVYGRIVYYMGHREKYGLV